MKEGRNKADSARETARQSDSREYCPSGLCLLPRNQRVYESKYQKMIAAKQAEQADCELTLTSRQKDFSGRAKMELSASGLSQRCWKTNRSGQKAVQGRSGQKQGSRLPAQSQSQVQVQSQVAAQHSQTQPQSQDMGYKSRYRLQPGDNYRPNFKYEQVNILSQTRRKYFYQEGHRIRFARKQDKSKENQAQPPAQQNLQRRFGSLGSPPKEKARRFCKPSANNDQDRRKKEQPRQSYIQHRHFYRGVC